MRQMLKANTRYFVGKIELDKHVDITDPMYDRSVWCRTRTQCKPRTYFGYVDTVDTEFMGNLIAKLSIYKDDRRTDLAEMEEIAEIGVDSGMAGFFRNKPDFSDDDYDKLGVITNEGDFWNAYDGIFSFSGCGDGSYPVYASKDEDAFTIVFYDPDEDEQENEIGTQATTRATQKAMTLDAALASRAKFNTKQYFSQSSRIAVIP